MYLTLTVMLLLLFAIIVIIAIVGYNKFEEMSLRITEADRLLMELKNNKKLDNIIGTMSVMANGYVSLKDRYVEMAKQNSDILSMISEIQERYCDSYEQFEHCTNELKEIRKMLAGEIIEGRTLEVGEIIEGTLEVGEIIEGTLEDGYDQFEYCTKAEEIQNGSEIA